MMIILQFLSYMFLEFKFKECPLPLSLMNLILRNFSLDKKQANPKRKLHNISINSS